MFLTIAAGTACIMSLYPWLREQAFADSTKISASMMEGEIFEGYFTDIGGQYYAFYDTWRIEHMIVWIMLGSFALTALLAFITGLIRPLGLIGIKFFSLPFEFLFVIGLMAIHILSECFYDFFSVIWLTVTGKLRTELMEELYMGYRAAGAVAVAINVLMWFLCLLFVYWFVVSAESVFLLGIKRWFKERTLLGRILRWGRRTVWNTCTLVESVDFRDQSTKLLLKITGINFLVLAVISCFWFYGIFGLMLYSVGLFFLLRWLYNGMQSKYQLLLDATGKMAEGNLEVEIQENLGIFEPLRGEITKIRNGFKKAVEAEVRSRSMKTELITNVSHDLKTPLTAIITYISLLKKNDVTEEDRKSYIEILDQKSMRLKSLIEDLFEISKANSNNVTLNLMEVDVVSLMKQVRLELDDKISGSGIDFRFFLPEEKVVLTLDSDKTYRIFENLLVNIVKYAMPGTRAYVEIREEPGIVVISMKNISAVELTMDGADMTERFVRGDASRNTEGSGLGLAIAKSFTELQNGTMEVTVEADLFRVRLAWERERKPENRRLL